MALRKLKLELDDVQVESFAPQAVASTRGTALGYATPSGQFGPECASRWPNCNRDVTGIWPFC